MARWTSADLPDQSGRTVLVTGANSGLGLRSAEALARRGATVVMACRSAARAEAARARVAAVASGPPPVVVPLDLADLASVRKAAAEVDASVAALDVLMNNAGVMAPPPGRTADGFEVQFGTNHLGHFALTGLLLGALRRAPAPRVVTTSSLMHRWHAGGWDDRDLEGDAGGRWPAYGRSKLANLLFMRELARRSAEAGVGLVSVAAHPGYASTHLQVASAAASAGGWLVQRAAGAAVAAGNRLVAQSDAAGALPQLYAATMPDVAAGDYFGPGGPFEMRGSPTRVGLSAAARDDAAARRLWAVSEQLTGVTYPW
ncbi:MAG: SDR family NAD(P)-dependent oxidoreductase [Acidimicrobiales bacterium]|nr:SDR family NAD(P)-dependent oxidoreductase [Acidimicrobiales bacterium]